MPERSEPLSPEMQKVLDHLTEERERMDRLTNIREVVFGGQDGLVTTATVVAGIAASGVAGNLVLLAGLIAALGGTISMAAGAFTSSKATAQVAQAEVEHEIREIEEHPESEKLELMAVFQSRGMTDDESRSVAEAVGHHRDLMIEMLLAFELGLTRDQGSSAGRDATVMGGTFFLLSIVPLIPFLFGSGLAPLAISIATAVAGLGTLGVVKARLAKLPTMRSAIELILIGSGSAAAGYLLGLVASRMLSLQPQ